MILRLLFRWAATATLLAVFAVSALHVTGQSAGAIWSAPIRLGPGWWQRIVVDVRGSAHVFWYGAVPDRDLNDVVIYTHRDRGGTWSAPTDVIATNSNIANTRPSPAITSDGRLFLAYRQYLWHMFSSTWVKDANSPASWTDPIRINDQGYYIDLLADRNDVLHMVFNARFDSTESVQPMLENSICPLCYDLFYQRSEDGGKSWSALYPLSLEPTAGSDRMDIAEGQSGNLYIFWDEGLDWHIGRGVPKDVRIVYSRDSGLTWSDPIILDGGNHANRHPIQIGLTELPNQVLLAVWRYSTDDDLHIYYQVSSNLGADWSEPQPIPGITPRSINDTPLDDYEVVTDMNGTAHLFAVGRQNPIDTAPVGVYHIEFRQQNWRQPELIFEDPTRKPEWPKAAVGPQNDIHLTWFNRYGEKTADGGEAGLEVMYSYRSPTLPDRPTQAFRPTAAPPPTAVAAQRFEPTLTPFPTVEPIAQQVNVRTTSDLYAIQTLLAAVFVGLVLCGGLLALRGFRLRR